MSTAPAEKKRRAKRNYQKELQRLADYLQIKIDVLKSMDGNGDWTSSIEAYTDVLAKLDGK